MNCPGLPRLFFSGQLATLLLWSKSCFLFVNSFEFNGTLEAAFASEVAPDLGDCWAEGRRANARTTPRDNTWNNLLNFIRKYSLKLVFLLKIDLRLSYRSIGLVRQFRITTINVVARSYESFHSDQSFVPIMGGFFRRPFRKELKLELLLQPTSALRPKSGPN
jgi:hypothetical protein